MTTRDVEPDDAAQLDQRIDSDISEMLVALAVSGALSHRQAEFLASGWVNLDDDIWSQPWLRGIGEHTRAYVERFRGAPFSQGGIG